jgi:ribosomal protein L32
MAEYGSRHTNLHKIIFFLSLCEQCSEYKIKHLLSFAPFTIHLSHTDIHGLATPLYVCGAGVKGNFPISQHV